MGIYVIGSGGDYASFSAAEADLTLPEIGGTTYQVTGTVTGDHSFTPSGNYSNGLTLEAVSGEEADGAGGGAYADGDYTLPDGATTAINNLRVQKIVAQSGSTWNATNCVIGEGGTGTVSNHSSTGPATLDNCILIGASGNYCFYHTTSDPNSSADKCTFIDAGSYNAVRAVFTNCLALGGGTGDYLSAESGSDYNASEDSSAPGTTVYTSRTTSDLSDYAGGDYNLNSGSSLQTAGSGGDRIGADLSGGGGGSSMPAIAYHYRHH